MDELSCKLLYNKSVIAFAQCIVLKDEKVQTSHLIVTDIAFLISRSSYLSVLLPATVLFHGAPTLAGPCLFTASLHCGKFP